MDNFPLQNAKLPKGIKIYFGDIMDYNLQIPVIYPRIFPSYPYNKYMCVCMCVMYVMQWNAM